MFKFVLLRFRLDRKALGLSSGDVTKIYRKLYGYDNRSHYGRYRHWVGGVMDEVKGKKVGGGNILVPSKNIDRLLKFLDENNAIVDTISDRIFMEEEDFDRIISMGKDEEFRK